MHQQTTATNYECNTAYSWMTTVKGFSIHSLVFDSLMCEWSPYEKV